MTMIDAGATTRPESDYVKITQIAAIGSLADLVLRELITLGSDDARPLSGIQRAAEFFRTAASGAGQPRTIWDSPTLADELLHFSANAGGRVEEVGNASEHDGRPWMDELATALESVSVGSPSPSDIERVRTEFTKIADQTMQWATQLVDARHAS